VIAFNIIYPDMIVHVDGCADFGKSVSRNYMNGINTEQVSGETLSAAIDALNETLADAFCEIAYTDESVEAGCWTINTANLKPCVKALMKKERITTDERGRPVHL
jgi:hypothetical protein